MKYTGAGKGVYNQPNPSWSKISAKTAPRLKLLFSLNSYIPYLPEEGGQQKTRNASFLVTLMSEICAQVDTRAFTRQASRYRSF